MAFRRRLGNLAGTLLQSRLKRREMDHQSELIAQRQREADEFNSGQQLLGLALKDPSVITRLVNAGQQRIAGVDISTLMRNRDDAQRQVGEKIASFTKGEELPDEASIDAMIHAADFSKHGEGEDHSALLRQVDSRRAGIRGAVKPEAVDYVGPDGTKQKQFMNPFEAASKGPLQAERTGTQEGQRAGQIAVAEAPGKTEAANVFESGTRAEKVKTAGAESGARASAQNRAEIDKLNNPQYQQGRYDVTRTEREATLDADYDPEILQKKLQVVTQEGMAKAAAERNAEAMKHISDAANTISAVLPDWEKLKVLSRKVNTSNTANVGTYYIQSPLQTNPDAAAMDMIAKNLAKRLANDPRFGGNKGAQSEKDSEAILGRLMNSYDTKEIAQRKIRDMEDNMYKGLAATAAMPPGASPQDKVNIMRKSIGLPPLDLTNPSGSGSAAVDKWRQAGGQ